MLTIQVNTVLQLEAPYQSDQYGGKEWIWEVLRNKLGFHRKGFFGQISKSTANFSVQKKKHRVAKIGWRPIYIEVF